MVLAILHGPRAETRDVAALGESDGRVLVPRDGPVCAGRLVEENGPHERAGPAREIGGEGVNPGGLDCSVEAGLSKQHPAHSGAGPLAADEERLAEVAKVLARGGVKEPRDHHKAVAIELRGEG